jgi:cell division septation protein DedD
MTNFYQSPSDKARFDVLLKVLGEEAPNLAIIGDDEVALAHYGRTIYQRLSQQPNAQVDLWGAVDSEQLVNRFNAILSELTLEQAQDKSQKDPIRRCFIITDAQAVQTLELQLLSRLIQGFPASHVHAVLLVHSTEPYHKKLEVFGKSLLRWELESEKPSPTRMQRIETRDAETPVVPPGAVASTASVLGARQVSRPAAAPVLSGAATPALEATASSTDPWSKTPELNVSAMPELNAPIEAVQPDAASTLPAPPARTPRLGWGLLLALLVAMAALGVMNRDRVVQEWEQLQRYVSGKRSAPVNADPQGASDTPARVGMSSTTQSPVKPDDSLIPDKETIVTPAAGESTAATPAPVNAANTATAAPAPSTPSAPSAVPPVAASAVPATSAAPAAPAPLKPEPNPMLAESRQWVRDLPSNGWVLQHAALDTLAEAKALKASSSSLEDARILMTQRKAKGYYYIVVTGPYANRAAAQEQMNKNATWAKAWLRGPKSMQQQFED